VSIGQVEGLRVPSVTTSTAIRLQGEPTLSAIGCEDNDGAARATASARIVGGSVVGIQSVGGESGCTGQAIGANENHSSAGRPTAGLIVTVRIISSSCTASAADRNAVNRRGEWRAAFAARTEIGAPRVATKSARPAIRAATTTRVLVIVCWMSVGSTTAGVGRSAARHAAIGASCAAGIASQRV
jgi:hypothetical protein